MQIILTHEHADAVLGLDDIRSVQPYSATNDIDPTSIYLSQHAMERCLYLSFFLFCSLSLSLSLL
jgi:phosphoribosyl 1,2-cyclic phosphodiesterase